MRNTTRGRWSSVSSRTTRLEVIGVYRGGILKRGIGWRCRRLRGIVELLLRAVCATAGDERIGKIV